LSGIKVIEVCGTLFGIAQRMVILTGIKHIIKPLIKENAKVLVIGCGNSRLSANIFDDCSTDVTSIDFSQVPISTASFIFLTH